MSVTCRVLSGLGLVLALFALVGATDSAFACVAGGSSPLCGSDPSPVSGAPGPIAGAGLPILAIGYGAYWLTRRLRRKPD
jgi:hypothetical protein